MIVEHNPPPFSFSPDTDSILSFTPMGTVEDFFNFDMLSGPAGGAEGGSSSRSSSRSPTTPLWNLSASPHMSTIPEISQAEDPFYAGMYEPQKSDALFGLFEDGSITSSTVNTSDLFNVVGDAPDSSMQPSTSNSDSPVVFAIDPSLTAGTPEHIPVSSSSPDDADIEDDESETSAPRVILKVGGKGVHNRKGTVATGGVRKGVPNGQVMTQAVRREDEPLDDDDWRPTPEEYKKMSSKEKRQLRNKISARNFRVRRKEYINTLEGDIAQRDTLIDAIRTELGSTKMENQALRQEVEALKKALLKSGITPDLPPPAPLSQDPPAAAVAASNKDKPLSRPILMPKANTHKDVPSTARISDAFWGGSKSGIGGFGGVTPVHTTLIPDFSPFMSDKLAERARAPLQENINPALNANPFFGIGASAHLPNESQHKVPFDAFSDMHRFTLRSLDAYRYNLWDKMATGRAPTSTTLNPWTSDTLASHLRPSYFSSPATSLLNGKLSKSTDPVPTPEQAVLATLASQTFMQKLSSAFKDAFMSATPSRNWDQEKMRKVVEGKAVLRVVDVAPKSEGIEALELSMRNMAIGKQGGIPPSPTVKEKLSLRPEPCFLQGLRAGTSALSGKK